MKPRFSSIPALATFTVTLALAMTAAQAQTWNGTANNPAWSVAGNWNPAAVPAAAANIIIAQTTASDLSLDGTTSRSIGSLTFGTTGTRATNFTLLTGANTLTMSGGIVANGQFSGTPTALAMRGNFVISADQNWSVGTLSTPNNDQGIFWRETTGTITRGTLALNANVNKIGGGQVIFGSTDVTGAGNVVVDAGWLKINAGSNLLVNVGGTGNLTFNNATTLSVNKNSGTMIVTRPVVMNATSTLLTATSNSGVVDIASPITFNGTPTLNVGATTNLTGIITGAGTITRNGPSALNISNTVSGFTGTLNLTTGVTTIQQNTFGGTIAVSAGASLNGETKTGGNLSLNGSGITADGSTAASLGTLGTLNLTGTNTVTVTGPPTSTSPFPVLTYGTLGSGGAANLTLANPGNFRNPVFDGTTPGVITLAFGSEARTWNGGAAWDINTSTNWLGGDQKFLQGDSVTFGNTGAGVVALTGSLQPTSITVNSTTDYEFTATAGNLIAGCNSLTKSGSSTLTLGGVNTFTGPVTINGGTIKLNANGALGGAGKAVTIASGATLDTNGLLNVANNYAVSIIGAGVGGNGAIVNSSGTDNTAGFGSLTLTGNAVVGGAKRFDLSRPAVAGAGFVDLGGFTLEKTGANIIGVIDSVMTAPGTINVTNGTLNFGRSVVSGAGSINVGLGATLQFQNNTSGSFSKAISVDNGTVRCDGNAFTISGPVAIEGFPFFQAEADLTIAAPVTGSASLTKAGAGILILGGAATHGGGTTVNAGTLQIGTGGTTGSIVGDILNFGTVAFNRSDAISYGNIISGSGGLTKQGAGTLTLTTAQGYTGNTNVNGGTLIAGGVNYVPAASLLNFANTAGTTFNMNGFSQEVRVLGGGGGTGGSVINGGGGTQTLTLHPATGDSATYAGNILGGIRVVVAGTKTVPAIVAPRQRLDGTLNTYTGGTMVDGSTLLVRTDGSLGAVPASFDNDNIILQNSGTLFNEADGVALDINVNRGILIGPGGGGLSGGFVSAGVTVRGVISGAAGNTLTVAANNSNLIFTADNTYAGDTIIQPLGAEPTQPGFLGRLVIGNGGTTGNHGTGNVINDGQLTIIRSDTFNETGIISGTGLLRQQGTGGVLLSAINTYTGNTEVIGGTLTLADNAGMKFLVTDTASNKVTGTATAVFNGDFTIDTSAVTVTTGSWTLVDVGTLTETFGPTFTVAGGWTENSNVWTKSGGGVTWTFTEATGVLSVAPGASTTFASWMGGFNFSAFPGADLSPTGDADGDGIRNAVEMVLGNQPNVTKVENMPTISLVTNPAGVPAGDYMKLSYRKTTLSADAGLIPAGQYDTDLIPGWSTAINGTAGVVVIETPNGAIPGSDVDVYIPRSLAAGGKLFGRLSVFVP